MVLEDRDISCTKCGNRFKASSRISPLGFPKYSCPRCGNRFIYPLSKRFYYWCLLIVALLGSVLAIAGLSSSYIGDTLLTSAILGALYVLERVSYILIPLAAWAFFRLIGMFYPSALQASRTILWYSGVAALVGIAVALLGSAASLVWQGSALIILAASGLLSLFSVLVLIKDAIIRRSLTQRE